MSEPNRRPTGTAAGGRSFALDDFRDRNPSALLLPPLLSMVVHHSRIGWTGGTQLLDLFDLDESLRADCGPWLPGLRFMLDDLTKASPSSLSKRAGSALSRLTLLCLQRIRDGGDPWDELRRLREAFLAALAAPDTGTALVSVLRYIAEVRDLSPEDLRQAVLIEIGTEMEHAMTSTYEQLVNRGRAEGRAEGEAGIVLKLLSQRFGELSDKLAERVRSASSDQLEQWAMRVLDAESVDQVFGDG